MITIEDVEHVAKLARLELTEEEKELFARQLADIVSYVDQLNELDTTDIEPMAHAIPMSNVVRDDKVFDLYKKEEMLAISPYEEDGFIRVPRITE